MYSTVIEIKSSITDDMLNKLRITIESAFSNRAGIVENTSNEPHRFIFKGNESDYGCLEVGMLTLKRVETFLNYVKSWKWIDEDPNECCDVLKVFATPVR